ncbi:hypothetical protein KCU83_g94, partial [Aureobasidium melanogenum]
LFLLYLLLPAASCQTCAMRHAATHDKSLADWRSATATFQRRTPQTQTYQLVLRQRRLFALNLMCCSDAIAAVAVHVQPHQVWSMHLLSHVTSTHVLPFDKAL